MAALRVNLVTDPRSPDAPDAAPVYPQTAQGCLPGAEARCVHAGQGSCAAAAHAPHADSVDGTQAVHNTDALLYPTGAQQAPSC